MIEDGLIDSFYQLYVAEPEQAFKKVKRLLRCAPPNEEKVLDDITSTEDTRTIQAKVNFTEESTIEFEYVYIEGDAQHKLLQDAYDTDKELEFQFKFVNSQALSRQFKGTVSSLAPNTEETRRKVRMVGTINVTSKPTAELTETAGAGTSESVA